MPGVTVREFECALCQQPFAMLAADFFIPQPDICEKCLKTVWVMDKEQLTEYTAGWLAKDSRQEKKPFSVTQVVQYILQYRQWSESAEAAIEDRKRLCGT